MFLCSDCSPTLILLPILLLAFDAIVIATPINITVDDHFGQSPNIGVNISYTGSWTQSGFAALGWPPDADDLSKKFKPATNGTWHKSTFERNSSADFPKATLEFNGTAVYVQCILTHATNDRVPGNSDMLFTLDDRSSVSFSRVAPPDGAVDFVTVFQKDDLSLTHHTLTIQNGRQNGSFPQGMVFLDSIIYTTDDPSGLVPNLASEGSDDIPSSTHHTSSSSATDRAPVVGDFGGSDPPAPPNTSSPASASESESLPFVDPTSSQAEASATSSLTPASQSPSRGSGRQTALVPAVCGALAGLLVVGFAFWAWQRHRRRRRTLISFDTFRFVHHRFSANATSTLTGNPAFSTTDDESIRSDSYSPSKESFTSYSLSTMPHMQLHDDRVSSKET